MQGVLVRFVVSRIGEERTLLIAMATTSLGFSSLSYVHSVYELAPALALVSVGYGLAVCPRLEGGLLLVPQLETLAGGGARLRGWAALRTPEGRLRHSDPSHSMGRESV